MAGSTGDLQSFGAQTQGVQAIRDLISQVQASRTFPVGQVTALNNINSSAASQVLAAQASSVASIVFHNPSNTVELLVGISSVATASFSSRGGSFLLLPGDYLTVSGNVSWTWSGIAQSGTNNPLTVITSST